ncbi:hypothetical protein A5743_13670 [Mycolicibacterium conceptionense]|nr:hypothetical protein A5743_13670 [Mycolicibacterium conceptionense]
METGRKVVGMALRNSQIRFTLDGREAVVSDEHPEAGCLLRLAGIDTSRFHLVRIDNRGVETRVRHSDVVRIRPGDNFTARPTAS